MIPKSGHRFSDKIMLKRKPCRTGRGKALNKDPFGHAYLHSLAASSQIVRLVPILLGFT
jgi:hypothetical protein